MGIECGGDCVLQQSGVLVGEGIGYDLIRTKANAAVVWRAAMTVETMFGIIMSTMLAIIGFWVKSLVNDFRDTRDNVIAMHEVMSNTTQEIISLKKSDELITQRIVEIIERLVRLEERTSTPVPQKKAYKRVKSGQ